MTYFLYMIGTCHLTQVVREPTRSAAILDLMLTTISDRFTETKVIETVSDHNVTFVEFILPAPLIFLRQR